MSEQAQKVLEQALALSAEERAKLAHDLMVSLDGPSDPDAEAAWAEELQRRAARVRSGESVGVPWEEVRERIERKLRGS